MSDTTEWATGKDPESLLTWKSREQAEVQSASDTVSKDGGKTWEHTNTPVWSRQVGPWVRADNWEWMA